MVFIVEFNIDFLDFINFYDNNLRYTKTYFFKVICLFFAFIQLNTKMLKYTIIQYNNI